MTNTEIDAVLAGLTQSERFVWAHERFDPKGWEPADTRSPLCQALVAKGLARVADGRCGFERFKDSFLVPTPLGLAVRAKLTNQPETK